MSLALTMTLSFQRKNSIDFLRTLKYLNWSTALSILILPGILPAQNIDANEVHIISKLVGFTIESPEQDYYKIFGNVRDFRSAQFYQTGNGFTALIVTGRGNKTRNYTRRKFYDLGLEIDRKGPIDPEVWKVLSGQRTFEAVAAGIDTIPIGVEMTLSRSLNRVGRGTYLGFKGHHFYLKDRRGRKTRISISGISRINYRGFPIADSTLDKRVYRYVAGAGAAVGYALSWLTGAKEFDTAGPNIFMGALIGMAIGKYVLMPVRKYRAETFKIGISSDDRRLIRSYTYLAFGEQ